MPTWFQQNSFDPGWGIESGRGPQPTHDIYGTPLGPGGGAPPGAPRGADIPTTQRQGDWDITSGGFAGDMSRRNARTGETQYYNKQTGQWVSGPLLQQAPGGMPPPPSALNGGWVPGRPDVFPQQQQPQMPMTPLSQIVTGVAGGAPRVPSTARVPHVGSPDWYAGQFPGAPQAPRGYNPFQDPARQARMEYWRGVPGGGQTDTGPGAWGQGGSPAPPTPVTPGGAYDPAQGHGYTPATAVGTGEGPSGALGPGGYVQLRAPTGQMRSVPAAQAAFYLARGASKV